MSGFDGPTCLCEERCDDLARRKPSERAEPCDDMVDRRVTGWWITVLPAGGLPLFSRCPLITI